MKNSVPDRTESKFETALSYLLIAGVIASLVLEIAGVILLYRSYGNFDISREPGVYIKGHDFFSFISQQIKERQISLDAILLMTAGIIILILTPYLRVIASVAYFIWQKNMKYLLITLFVLVVVTISLALH